MASVTIYTDGACSGNPGPGAWAAILTDGIHEKVVTGFKPETTNNEMEVVAVLEGLKALKGTGHDVTVVTDSLCVIGWLSRGYKRKAAHLRPLLAECDTLIARHTVKFVHGENRAHSEAAAVLERNR